MRPHPLLPALLLALLLVSLVAGCSSYREVPAARWGEVGPPGEPSRGANDPLAPGDRVRLRLRDGCNFEGRLARVGPDSLVVTGARELPRWDDEFAYAVHRDPCLPTRGDRVVTVAVADIAEIERPYPSPTKSFLMVLASTTIAAMIVLLLALHNSTGWD